MTISGLFFTAENLGISVKPNNQNNELFQTEFRTCSSKATAVLNKLTSFQQFNGVVEFALA